MYKHDRLTHFVAALSVTILTAFLEIAWFNPQHPRQAWSDVLEVVSMVCIVLIVSWPRWWWVPLLLTFQEVIVYGAIGYYGTHDTLGYLRWTFSRHWTTYLFGINLYPWISGPVTTLSIEAIMRRKEKRKKECPFCERPNCDYFQTGRCEQLELDYCSVCGGVREFEGGEFYHMLKCPNIPKDGDTHYPHDYMTCPYPKVPCSICEEAESQSVCYGCAGWWDEDGFVHEKGCLKAIPGDRTR